MKTIPMNHHGPIHEFPTYPNRRHHRLHNNAIAQRRCIESTRLSSVVVDRRRRGQNGDLVMAHTGSTMPFQTSCNVANHEAKSLLTSPELSAISVDTQGHFADNSFVSRRGFVTALLIRVLGRDNPMRSYFHTTGRRPGSYGVRSSVDPRWRGARRARVSLEAPYKRSCRADGPFLCAFGEAAQSRNSTQMRSKESFV